MSRFSFIVSGLAAIGLLALAPTGAAAYSQSSQYVETYADKGAFADTEELYLKSNFRGHKSVAYRGHRGFHGKGLHSRGFHKKGFYDKGFYDQRGFHNRGFHKNRGFHNRGFKQRGFHGKRGFKKRGLHHRGHRGFHGRRGR